MSFTWTAAIQHCLIAYVATPPSPTADGYARTAVRYLQATLDDLQIVGDGKGGDDVIKRDSGYSVRVIVPFTALAVDWLGNHPALTPALRARALSRWQIWLRWYASDGYNAHRAGANYQAGYLLAASLAWRVQGDAARDLGREVVQTLWQKDMASALAPTGVLAGGDWPEGQQYAPLAIAAYAFAARALHDVAALPHQALGDYLTQVMARYVAGQSPDGKVFAGGDTDTPTPNIEPSMLTLAAVAMAASSESVRAAAITELRASKLHFDDFILYEALVLDGPQPTGAPATMRNDNATAYVAEGTQTFFARTGWSRQAAWLVTNCGLISDMDHRPADAGNLVFARGTDHILVDPSPYGSLSSLTSNAPTIRSSQLPKEYVPSQGTWGRATGLRWAKQSPRGVMLASCDYTDQFRFKDEPSDVRAATRDIVGLPLGAGDFAVVVADIADTGAPQQDLHVRFRVPTKLTRTHTTATGKVGQSQVTLALVASTPAAEPQLRAPTRKDCWAEDTPRGQCTAARFSVNEFAVTLAGPRASALTVTTAVGRDAAVAMQRVEGSNVRFGVQIQQQVALWTSHAGPVTYQVPASDLPGLHVVTTINDLKGSRRGSNCVFQGTAASNASAPTIWVIDRNCQATQEDGRRAFIAEGESKNRSATAPPLAVDTTAVANRRPAPTGSNGARRAPKAGSCSASNTADLPILLIVLATYASRKRKK